jgi:hypothetical protein
VVTKRADHTVKLTTIVEWCANTVVGSPTAPA